MQWLCCRNSGFPLVYQPLIRLCSRLKCLLLRGHRVYYTHDIVQELITTHAYSYLAEAAEYTSYYVPFHGCILIIVASYMIFISSVSRAVLLLCVGVSNLISKMCMFAHEWPDKGTRLSHVEWLDT